MRLFTRTSPYSVYADAESAPPDWKPGEEDAAIAFLAITLFLILDINIGIHRVFRRKQGLYYWSLIIATWACATDTIGTMLKNFKPSWGPKIWPLWTTFILCGWSLFATAELFILFSRLHLVNRNRRVQRGILIMIIVGSFLLVVPNWVMIFPAYDVNPSISSIWSPRMAIVDRTSQLGFSLMETVISAVYIASLIKILRVKSTVRQRRVMFDLIYVNLIVISVDIVVTVLTFLNQVNLAYPIQVFSYALKFKLEFVVLNQLMAVAARGLKRESFAERRYHNENETQPSTRQEKGEDEYPLNDLSGSTQGDKGKSDADNSVSKLAPFGLKSKQKKSPREAYERMNSDTPPEPPPKSDSTTSKSDTSSYDIHLKPAAEQQLKTRDRPIDTNVTATRRRKDRGEDEDEEEDEIGVHMWENRGRLVLDVPWLQDSGQGT